MRFSGGVLERKERISHHFYTTLRNEKKTPFQRNIFGSFLDLKIVLMRNQGFEFMREKLANIKSV